eukprot:TRINITY_DN5467_c0_g1_i1.p1 TRINITY_DN5467_c0_g1~~TRINITY_DN5467_c0_g1_i1.p1  ORF type:complete len:452 (+),score=93.52 TRINITY_DN5467_c0_g1_i1:185-1357(+)
MEHLGNIVEGEDEENLEKKKTNMERALQDLSIIEKNLDWLQPRSLVALKHELQSTIEFYSFFMNARSNTDTPDLGYFSVVPKEVLLLIFSYLGIPGLLSASCVCKPFYEYSQDEYLWKTLAKSLLDEHQIENKPMARTWRWLCVSLFRTFKEGAFKDGPGVYRFPNQVANGGQESRYSGDWKDDKRHGYGTFTWANGSLYIGEWVEDKREGFGTRIWPNKNRYTGQYKNHKRHGKGEFTFSNGSVFTGTFEDNKFIKGTYTWPNGRVYDGEWDNIFRHGKGSYWWPDGRTYEGEWKNDKRHGNGTYKWPDGDVFEGKFIDGKRSGRGTLRVKNGDVYDQEWNEEKFEEYNKGLEFTIDSNGLKQPALSLKRKNPEQPEHFKKNKRQHLED